MEHKKTNPTRLSIEEFKNSSKHGVFIILDNIRSSHNVGSIFRSSDAFMVEKIYLCGITSTPPNREINKTALGATESVSWEHAENCESLIKKLKNKGIKIIGVEQTESSDMLGNFNFELGNNYAFVFGNEVDGVQQEVLNLCDNVIEIPQLGTKRSLNVSVSVGIVLWQANNVLKSF